MLDWKKRESLLSKFLTRKHTYHQDILFLCSSVENSAFREIYGKSTGYLRGMYGKCLNNISRCSNPLHIDVLRILREMLPSFVKFMINKWNPTNSFLFTWNFRNNSISLQCNLTYDSSKMVGKDISYICCIEKCLHYVYIL